MQVLVDTPLAPYFSDNLTSEDLDEMNIEVRILFSLQSTSAGSQLASLLEFYASSQEHKLTRVPRPVPLCLALSGQTPAPVVLHPTTNR